MEMREHREGLRAEAAACCFPEGEETRLAESACFAQFRDGCSAQLLAPRANKVML